MSRGQDGGAAVVDFVLVGALLTLVFVGVVQLAVVLHVRNTLIDCASEGARYGALADRDPAAGARRARQLIAADLSPRFAGDVSAGMQSFEGYRTVTVTITAPLPMIGLIGPNGLLTVRGQAAAERP